MSQLIEELENMGCDMEGAMGRFLDNEDLYFECLKKALDDSTFKKLGTALKEKNIEESFDHAHNIKGLMANMGLTPIFDGVVKIVEPLRLGNYSEELITYYEDMMGEFDKIYQVSLKYQKDVEA